MMITEWEVAKGLAFMLIGAIVFPLIGIIILGKRRS